MAISRKVVMFCVLLLSTHPAAAWEWPEVSDVVWGVAVPAAGGVAAVAAVPVVLSGLGFGAAGVAVGSIGSKVMSAAWSTGVGVGAVGALQSAGAAGLTAAQSVVVGSLGATVTRYFTGGKEKDKPDNEC